METWEAAVPRIWTITDLLAFSRFFRRKSIPWTSTVWLIPRIVYVSGDPPAVGNRTTPVPRVVLAPKVFNQNFSLEQTRRYKQNYQLQSEYRIGRPVSLSALAIVSYLRQLVPHPQKRITDSPCITKELIPRLPLIITIIILQIINPPARKRIRIYRLEPLTARIPPARVLPRGGIHPKPQTQRVQVIRNSSNAIGELSRVRNERIARAGPPPGAPAIVQDDIVVAQVFEAIVDN